MVGLVAWPLRCRYRRGSPGNVDHVRRRGLGMVGEVVEDGPSIAGRLAWLGARLTIRPTLAIGSHVPHLPWPWGIIDFASRAVTPIPGTVRATIGLPNCTARFVRAKGVLPADGTRRIVLYMHGGAFLTCGAHSHGRLTTMIRSTPTPGAGAELPDDPKHSVGEADRGLLRRLALAAQPGLRARPDRAGRRLGGRLPGARAGRTPAGRGRGAGRPGVRCRR